MLTAHGRTDIRTDGRTDARTDRHTHGRTDRHMDGFAGFCSKLKTELYNRAYGGHTAPS